MGFLEAKPEIFRTFWRNSGTIFRPVARPKPIYFSFHCQQDLAS